jgi:hypothetical protein
MRDAVAAALSLLPLVVVMALHLYYTMTHESKPPTMRDLIITVIGLVTLAIMGLVVFYQPLLLLVVVSWFYVLGLIGAYRMRAAGPPDSN